MTAAKDKMKQRSFYMDDETYALIERHAEKLGASNGTALRMIIRAELLDEQPAPVAMLGNVPTRVAVERVRQPDGTERAGAEIILPPASQETFRVPEHMREKHQRTPRPTHVDDDF